MTDAVARRWNWPLWTGFLLTVFAFISYFVLFVKLPVTRDFPWANLLLFALAAVLLVIGVSRAFRRADVYRGKVLGPMLGLLSVLVFSGFVFLIFIAARDLPLSSNAPRVGAKAPEFTLLDTSNKPVSLAELLSTPLNGAPPKGVLLVFYRGYW